MRYQPAVPRLYGSFGHPGELSAPTVMVALPLRPPLVAVTVAAPTAMPDTRPFNDTVASAALLVVQVTGWPAMGLPFASFGVAESCAVCPTVMLAEVGLTFTEATATGETVTLAVPFTLPLDAVMVADP